MGHNDRLPSRDNSVLIDVPLQTSLKIEGMYILRAEYPLQVRGLVYCLLANQGFDNNSIFALEEKQFEERLGVKPDATLVGKILDVSLTLRECVEPELPLSGPQSDDVVLRDYSAPIKLPHLEAHFRSHDLFDEKNFPLTRPEVNLLTFRRLPYYSIRLTDIPIPEKHLQETRLPVYSVSLSLK
jgi:hypothetical protein